MRSWGNPEAAPDTTTAAPSLAKAYADIYHFRFAKTDSAVTALKSKYPEDAKVFLFSANACWWKIRAGEDNAANRKQFLADLRQAELLLGKTPKNKLGNEALFQYIHVYSYMARLELLDGNYLKAFSFINKCSAYLFTSFGRELMYEPLFLTTGLYHYCMAAARKKFPLLSPFLSMLPATDKEEGLKLLGRCSESSDEILRTEGRYFLMTVYGESDINYALSESYAEKLCIQYPGNMLYRHYLFKTLLQDEKKDRALEEYKRLYRVSRANDQLSLAQQDHFLSLAKKDLVEYYKKHPEATAN